MNPFGLGVWEVVLIVIIAIIILACIVGAIFLLAWAFRRAGSGGSTSSATGPTAGPRTALDIAQERYARGEINRDEYQQIVADLRK